ncbi:hypothetical protein RIF29_40505 [Crotalaria pallida]|uniref:Protein TIFY n=1 Tax=Crotalaria pallida TaxID=3830 RepID=A0AAN9HRR7_CROPI
MRRNCNLELALFPPCGSSDYHHHPMMEEANCESPKPQYLHHHQQQQRQEQVKEQQHTLTIFYDGKICVSDVTEVQAKSILMLANKKANERMMRTASGSEPSTPTVVQSHPPLYSPGTPLSMKISLQRFLQKRKIRKQEASPYNH